MPRTPAILNSLGSRIEEVVLRSRTVQTTLSTWWPPRLKGGRIAFVAVVFALLSS